MVDRVSKSYRGMRKRQWGKWVSEIHDPILKKQFWIGSFETAEKAARAYDTVAFYFRGSKSRLNFPKAVHTLPSFPANPSIDEIREVARQSVGATAISESGGGGASISGVTELGLVDEEEIISVENNPKVNIEQVWPSQIQSLREWPLYSPELPMLEQYYGKPFFGESQRKKVSVDEETKQCQAKYLLSTPSTIASGDILKKGSTI
ncbi:unnamed protein product [Citrullus colocynthis]|uniref:AP2/ERF domain-containing protein n=1 Tax=Citrullus colocynthis TaxID=252529 RepID=A0ABP0YY88_9ROSI